MTRTIRDGVFAALWNEKGPYRATTVDKIKLHPGRVLNVARTKYRSPISDREFYVVRVHFEGNDYAEVRSNNVEIIDQLAREFEAKLNKETGA
jgi:hypothetical protein